jgi:hypothetical protein
VEDGVCAAVRIPMGSRGLPDERKYPMKAICIAVLAASFVLPLAAVAQQQQQDSTTTTTTQTNRTDSSMSPADMRAQRKAQKQDKKAANDRLKAKKEKNKAVDHDNKAADAAANPQ